MLKLDKPGEHSFTFSGQAGLLEGILTVPQDAKTTYIALIGHPHSLHGGTMHNKVVTTLTQLFKSLGIASIRFNFRGVGASEGEYDAGIGESEDMLQLARDCQASYPAIQFIFAGFSFGSYVTYRAAVQWPHALLISISPPVHHYDYNPLSSYPYPWIIVQGDADEVVPVEEIRQFIPTVKPSPVYIEMPDTSHFFHGKLIELKQLLSAELQALGLS